jgi:large subunit ribosomal protein L17
MSTYKLSRKSDDRNRTLRNLATSLVLYERIVTTEAKAKAVTPMVERILTVARQNNLASRRWIQSQLFDTNAVRKLFEDFPQRWGTRTSGFVRITKQVQRKGDGARMATLEIILRPLEEVVAEETAPAAKPRKTTKKAAVAVEKKA